MPSRDPQLRGVPALLAVCATVVAVSIVGLASDFLTHLVSNIDGLLLLMICVMMAGIFSLILFAIAKESGLVPTRRPQSSQPAGSAPPPVKEGKA